MNMKSMFHKSFIDSFFLRLADAVDDKVQKKGTKKDLTKYDEYDRLGKLLARLMMPKDWALRKSRNLLQLGIAQMKSERFPDKLEGAKTINEECKTIASMTYADNIDALVQVLLDAKNLELFFNKDSHA